MAVSRQFTDLLAKRLGTDPEATFKLMSMWQPYEGGSEDNPLNTTENMPGATNWNEIGVKRYKSLADGVEATARTLTNGLYPNILNAMKTGKIDGSIAPDVRTWTSGKPDGGSHFADSLGGGQNSGTSAAGGGRTGVQMPPLEPGDGTAGGTQTPVNVDPRIGKQHDALMNIAAQALDKYLRTKDPKDLMEYQLAQGNQISFESGHPEVTADYANQMAQKAFDNALKLGDVGQAKAAADFTRWKTKSDMAQSNAEAVITDSMARNKARDDAVLNSAKNYGAQGYIDLTTYTAPTFDKGLKAWQDKLGVGAEPATYSGATPAAPVFNGGGTGTGGSGETTDTAAPVDQGADFWGTAPRYPSPPPNPFGYPKTAQPDTGGGFWDTAKNLGSALGETVGGIAGGSTGAGAIARKAIETYPKNAKKWWNTLGDAVLHHATGTASSPGGSAMLGEKGPEIMIDPQTGQPVPVGQNGPEVRNISPGTAVIPNGVPPDEALAWSQIQAALKSAPGVAPGQDAAAQQARANDPQLQQKVIESLKKALAARDAQNPPRTPILTGPGPQEDLWGNWRPLTVVGVDGQPHVDPAAQPAGGRR